MKSVGQIAEEAAERARAQRWAETEAEMEGAKALEALWAVLDDASCFRGEVLFDMSPRGEERAVIITRDGRTVAKWTRRGRTLLFAPVGGAQETSTTSVEDAVGITVEFLLGAPTKPAVGRRIGYF